jgi:AbrB family looped-hinge helix DNA binding protein
MLENMKIDERGRVTLPKGLRDRFGLKPKTEVEILVVGDCIVLRTKSRSFARWKGHCNKSFEELDYARVDKFMEDVRGRRSA